MKKKLSILIALVMAISLCLVTAMPVAAATDRLVPSVYGTIQEAINAADPGDTIIVAAGEYAGAIVNKDVTIIGAADGTSVITSGPHYGGGHPTACTAFLLDAGAGGAEIRNFTINCATENFWFGVYARNADSVIVDSLAINDTVQGISNWGGSNWEITNNVITETYPTTGGGIAIYLGADPTNFPHCDSNLVQGNTMSTNRSQASTFTGAAICLWFDERVDFGGYVIPTDQSMTGNEIIGNSMTAIGQENQVGIEIGVGGLENLDETDNPEKVAACLGVIHDNIVQNNTIDNAEWGLHLYVTTNLTVSRNTIKNCSDCGIYMKDDSVNCLINNNNIYGNTNYGLNNTDGAAYSTTVDATYNWWGSANGPFGIGANPVSESVAYEPWYGSLIVFTTESSTEMTAIYTPTPPPVIGISLDTLLVDFGEVVPGVASDPQSVTVTNEGNVPEDFSTTIINESHPLVYSTGLALTWSLTPPESIAVLESVNVPLVLTVPSGTPAGTYTATLVFWAEASP